MKEILDPASEYENELHQVHQQKMSDYFDSLVKESGVDIDANHKTVEMIHEEQRKLSKASSAKDGFVALQVILSVIVALALIVAIYFTVFLALPYDENSSVAALSSQIKDLPLTVSIPVTCVLYVLAIALIPVQATVVRKTINKFKGKINESSEALDELHEEAKKQMEAFNALYDWKAPLQLWNETVEIVNLDTYFDVNKYMYMKKKYKLSDLLPNESTLFVQSGSIVGNPFFFYKKLIQDWQDHIYTGSIVISYTTRVLNSEGEWEDKTVYETLTASVAHPEPVYSDYSEIVYANDAAPKLSFSRNASNMKYDMNSKSTIHHLDKEVKALDKMTTKAIKNDSSFNAINGDYFEAMWQCYDRSNENEYRLLFSPLARKSMINVMSAKDGYGDDFSFTKANRLNFIAPKHLVDKDISLGENYYEDEDFEQAKSKFNSFNENYFRSMFFGIAPILAIPLYQQYKPAEEIYKDTYKMVASPYQYESTANHYDAATFAHPQSITKNIIKTSVVSHNGDTDVVNVAANGFKGVPRVDIVPVWGGDGRYHDVPVNWTEYIAVQKVTPLVINETGNLRLNEFKERVRSNDTWKDFFKNFKGNSQSTKYNRDLISTISSESTLDAKGINTAFKKILKEDK